MVFLSPLTLSTNMQIIWQRWCTFLRREAMMKKERQIRAAGYNLVTIWECDYKKLIKSSVLLRHYLNSLDSDKWCPLKPRDAFYGGRTNACKLYYRCAPNGKKLYYEVCSLYPLINKYPIVNFETVDGLIKYHVSYHLRIFITVYCHVGAIIN